MQKRGRPCVFLKGKGVSLALSALVVVVRELQINATRVEVEVGSAQFLRDCGALTKKQKIF